MIVERHPALNFSTGLYGRQYFSPLREQRGSRHKREHNSLTPLIYLEVLYQ
jgi:hypothetical protein